MTSAQRLNELSQDMRRIAMGYGPEAYIRQTLTSYADSLDRIARDLRRDPDPEEVTRDEAAAILSAFAVTAPTARAIDRFHADLQAAPGDYADDYPRVATSLHGVYESDFNG